MGLDDVEALAGRWRDRAFIPTHLGDDVTGSDRPDIVFPADGQAFTLDVNGLTGSPDQTPERADMESGIRRRPRPLHRRPTWPDSTSPSRKGPPRPPAGRRSPAATVPVR
ncbi:hypothetical protein ACIBQ6_23180 [Nonomuraea sp. NPDC049655]|uniref:hypothetical protein n=1 Tax=Nonomuraea sp. NPDC049655 TaxID=3364355 RepID=UPI0037904371